MTEDRREQDRRMDDQTLAQKLDSHIERFDVFVDVLKSGEMVLPNGKTMLETVAEHGDLQAGQARTYDVLMGPEVEQPDGSLKRDKKAGLMGKVEKIDLTLSNGGVRVKLPPGLWVLLAAITTGLFGVGVALINAANQAANGG